MYQLEGVKDNTAVSAVFAKYCPGGVDKSDGNIFLSSDSMPDFCKLIGYASIHDTAKLEQIARVITDERYEKKAEKFEQKSDKMHKKVMDAKRATRQDTTIAMGGLTTAISIGQLVENVEKQDAAPDDPKVIKAQARLDKYMTKNQTLAEAKQFSQLNQGVGCLISIGVGDTATRGILQSIEESKAPNKEFTEPALKVFKEFLAELLQVADRVSVMHITDGNKTPTIHLRNHVGLGSLQAKQLIEAKNRESIIISK